MVVWPVIDGERTENNLKHFEANIEAFRSKIDLRIETFCIIGVRDLISFGAKKSFCGLFENFFAVVQKLFRHCFRP